MGQPWHGIGFHVARAFYYNRYRPSDLKSVVEIVLLCKTTFVIWIVRSKINSWDLLKKETVKFLMQGIRIPMTLVTRRYARGFKLHLLSQCNHWYCWKSQLHTIANKVALWLKNIKNLDVICLDCNCRHFLIHILAPFNHWKLIFLTYRKLA
jgi:hypothetical protein